MAAEENRGGEQGRSGEEIVAEFVRFCEKNPLIVRSLDNFITKNCSHFEGEEADEHKLEFTELFMEYQELVQRSIDLFLSKKNISEEALVKALSEDPHHDTFIDALLAKTDYETFASTMRSRRLKGLQVCLVDRPLRPHASFLTHVSHAQATFDDMSRLTGGSHK